MDLSRLPENIAKRIVINDECWNWTGYRTPGGYGRLNIGPNQPKMVHRIVYEIIVGEIPQGLTIDHLCRNRACCNPAHLEPVTMKVNVLRGTSFAARNAAKTHCVRGHEIVDPKNFYLVPGGRRCRICNHQSCARYEQAHRKGKRHRKGQRRRRVSV